MYLNYFYTEKFHNGMPFWISIKFFIVTSICLKLGISLINLKSRIFKMFYTEKVHNKMPFWFPIKFHIIVNGACLYVLEFLEYFYIKKLHNEDIQINILPRTQPVLIHLNTFSCRFVDFKLVWVKFSEFYCISTKLTRTFLLFVHGNTAYEYSSFN